MMALRFNMRIRVGFDVTPGRTEAFLRMPDGTERSFGFVDFEDGSVLVSGWYTLGGIGVVDVEPDPEYMEDVPEPALTVFQARQKMNQLATFLAGHGVTWKGPDVHP